MIEAVGTLSVSGSSLRSVSQSRAPYVQAQPVSNVPRYAGSRIRFDNFLNMAILEMRSNDTGEVTTQYPTESQIRAIQRASELSERREKLVNDPVDRQVQVDSADISVGEDTFTPDSSTAFSSIGQGGSYPSSVPLAAPAASVSAPIAGDSGTSSAPSAGSDYSTQSIVV